MILTCSVQDLISKWEKYVADHQVFDDRLSEYNDWIQQATQKLEQCCLSEGDQESMEEKRAMIQVDENSYVPQVFPVITVCEGSGCNVS